MTAPTDHPIPGSVLTEADVAAREPIRLTKENAQHLRAGDVLWRDGRPVTYREPTGASLDGWVAYYEADGTPGATLLGLLYFDHRPSDPSYRLSRPQPVSGSEGEGVEAAVERKPFDPQFYDDLRDHAIRALRERKPFTINADGALAIIDQAAADRASNESLTAALADEEKRGAETFRIAVGWQEKSEAQRAEIKALKEGLRKMASGYAGCDGFQDAQLIATEALTHGGTGQ